MIDTRGHGTQWVPCMAATVNLSINDLFKGHTYDRKHAWLWQVSVPRQTFRGLAVCDLAGIEGPVYVRKMRGCNS